MKQETLFKINKAKSHSWFESAIEFFDFENSPGWPDAFGDNLRNYFKGKNKINVLSLFSGGGGLDIAFHDVGFNVIECVEIEKNFTKTLEKNSLNGKRISNAKIICTDIRDYVPTCKNIDFIIGGPPCQTFSAAGARAAGVNGLDDKRGTLFEEYVRVLIQLKPKGFLFENVYRIVGAQGGKPWKRIREAFQNAGYNLFWRIIDSADYGVPQHRERLIIVGTKKGEFLFPYPTHGPDSQDNRPYYNAGTAVKELITSYCKVGINGRHGHLLNDIPPGLNYSFYTEKLGHPNPIFGWRSKFSDYLYKADPNTPVRTIKAQGGQYTGPFSWENRPFSIEEFKRLQTFPDDYEIVGNRQNIIAQLGNSVPPQCGRILALAVIDQVFNIKMPFRIQYLPRNKELGFRKRKTLLTKIYAQKAEKAVADLRLAGRITNNVFKKSKGSAVQYLKDNLVLSDCTINNAVKCNFDFQLDRKQWSIRLTSNKESAKEKFQIKIVPSDCLSSILGTKHLILSSTIDDYFSLVALWKFLEKKIKQLAHKDDLIQLFGYYQYRQKSIYQFDFLKTCLKKDKFWKVASQIVNGIAIGTPLHISEMSKLYGVGCSELLEVLKNLKSIGYEIRSHNTNSQLSEEHYLIPYPFATLNERSLQRLTTL